MLTAKYQLGKDINGIVFCVNIQSDKSRTDLNNLNYIGPVGKILISTRQVYTSTSVENYLRPVYTLGAVWGMQRNYKSHVSLDFNMGPGVVVSKDKVNWSGEKNAKNSTQFTIAGQFTVGFWLSKRQNEFILLI